MPITFILYHFWLQSWGDGSVGQWARHASMRAWGPEFEPLTPEMPITSAFVGRDRRILLSTWPVWLAEKWTSNSETLSENTILLCPEDTKGLVLCTLTPTWMYHFNTFTHIQTRVYHSTRVLPHPHGCITSTCVLTYTHGCTTSTYVLTYTQFLMVSCCVERKPFFFQIQTGSIIKQIAISFSPWLPGSCVIYLSLIIVIVLKFKIENVILFLNHFKTL